MATLLFFGVFLFPTLLAQFVPPNFVPPCVDEVLKNGTTWHDKGGSTYTCAWYRLDPARRCATFGHKNANSGFVANKACCICKDAKVVKQEIKAETIAKEESASGKCVDQTATDGSPWHDAGGSKYDCAWYAETSKRCSKFGNTNPWDGINANQACCHCGGGSDTLRDDVGSSSAPSVTPVVALFTLRNVTSEHLNFQPNNVINVLALVMNLPRSQLQILSIKDREDKRAPPKRDPFQERLNRFGVAPTPAAVVAKNIPVVDLEIQVSKLVKITSFGRRLEIALKQGALNRALRNILPTLTYCALGAPLRGPTCLGICGSSNTQYEHGKECYCSKECETIGDCCPSYYQLPCKDEKETEPPTVEGPGSWFLTQNSMWDMQTYYDLPPLKVQQLFFFTPIG